MTVRAEQLIEQIKARVEDARRIGEEAETRGWSAEDADACKHVLDEAQSLKAQLNDIRRGGDARTQLEALGADLGFEPTAAPSTAGDLSPAVSAARGGSLGRAFVNSAQYRSFAGQFPAGRIPDRARVNVEPVGFKGLISGVKQGDDDGDNGPGGPGLISVTGTAGAQGLVPPDYQGLVDTLGRPPLVLRNLVSVRTTTSDLIEYVRQLTRYPSAAWVPEARTLDDDDALKPMGGFDFEVVVAPVETVAQWIPITRRALMDAAQLRGLIDQELRDDLAMAEESTMLIGGTAFGAQGSAGQIEGLDMVSGTQTVSGEVFEATRRARMLVETIGFATPTAFVFSSEDDMNIDLMRDGMNRFFGNGPFGVGPNTLWGLPRVVSSVIPPGEAWVGDWRRAVIWDRQQATISVSDSHADFFVRNLVAVLGEERLAFGVVRPSAFCKIEIEEA